MRLINRIVIHCSATKSTVDYFPSQLLADHLQRGFSDCGYHFYITKDGTVHPMRPLKTPGAHAQGYNAHSIGICYEGGLDTHGNASDTRTPAQKQALSTLVNQLTTTYPICFLTGHRDLSPDLDGDGIVEPHEWTKICPCFEVKDEMQV
jgi:Negative regulator of beta-lactamase expression